MPSGRGAPQTALLIGRFQPFHRGHEKAVAHLLRRYPRLILAVGSAQERRTRDNPFSAVERATMVRRVAAAHPAWRGRVRLASMPDSPSNAEWTRRVAARFPPGRHAVGSANPLVRKLLGSAGYRIDPAPLFNRLSWQGETLRARIRAGRAWKPLMPRALWAWMERVGLGIVRGGGKEGVKRGGRKGR